MKMAPLHPNDQSYTQDHQATALVEICAGP